MSRWGVAKRRKQQTFADIAEEAKSRPASPAGRNDARPGRFNAVNDLFDPAGNLLLRVAEKVSPAEALELVRAGALVAYEGCGCGGYPGCQPEWPAANQRAALRLADEPSFPTSATPSWIDVWRGAGGPAIFVHGVVRWADVF